MIDSLRIHRQLSKVMKVYGGRIMCDLFALNYSNPSFSCKVKYTTPLVSKPYD